jgi:hypothetical protein
MEYFASFTVSEFPHALFGSTIVPSDVDFVNTSFLGQQNF